MDNRVIKSVVFGEGGTTQHFSIQNPKELFSQTWL